LERAARQWALDAAHVRAALAGRRASPLVPRAARATERPARVGRAFVVVRIVRETDDARTIELAPKDGNEVRFRAGQFFTVRAPSRPGVKRNYSASSSPDDARALSITVKRVAGGAFSPWLVEALAAGDELDLEGPFGAFVPPADARRLVLVAGGSGVTPLMSVIRSRRSNEARVDLVYANRSRESAIFGAELDALAAAGRIDLRHVVGPVFDPAALDAECVRDAHFMICGPQPMRAAAIARLEELGVPAARVLVERFTTETSAAPPAGFADQLVVLRRRGERTTLEVRAGETILAASRRARGAALPSSCEVGGCGACRVRVVHGEVAMEDGGFLDRAERDAGFVLACVSRPLGTVELELAE
jgi:ferredoxin-NADP reductase